MLIRVLIFFMLLFVNVSTSVSGQVAAGTDNIRANADWTPVEETFFGLSIILVPPGCFEMGAEDQGSARNVHPAHEICFNAPFWIDKYEVTNKAFARFLNTTSNVSAEGYEYLDADDEDVRISLQVGRWQPVKGFEKHPVVEVSWYAGRDFCAWRGGKLPNEAEWEYAASGPSNWRYPWGDVWDGTRLIWAGNRSETTNTAEVGSRPRGASWVGAMDMSGNVLEWTSSIEMAYPYDPADGRENLYNYDASILRIARGPSWLSESPEDFRTSIRAGALPDWRTPLIGFRCAYSDLSPPTSSQ